MECPPGEAPSFKSTIRGDNDYQEDVIPSYPDTYEDLDLGEDDNPFLYHCGGDV